MLVALFFCKICVIGHRFNTGVIGHSFAAVVLFLQHLYFWLFFAKSVLLVKFLQNWRHGCFYSGGGCIFLQQRCPWLCFCSTGIVGYFMQHWWYDPFCKKKTDVLGRFYSLDGVGFFLQHFCFGRPRPALP